jgi:oligopeptide transport system substrate-binding protein
MLGFDLRRPPFDSEPLREAFVLALDREIIAGKLLHGLYAPADTMVPEYPGHPAVRPGWAALSKSQRETRARALYAAAGYSTAHPLRVALSVPSMAPDTRRLFVACASMWRGVLGAEVQIENQEWRVFQQNRRLGQYRLFWHSWIGDYLDPSTYLAILQKNNQQNVGGFDDAAYEAAMDAAAAAVDPASRGAALARAEAQVNEAVAVLPIYYYQNRHLLRPYVAGWKDNVVDRHLSRDLWLVADGAR